MKVFETLRLLMRRLRHSAPFLFAVVTTLAVSMGAFTTLLTLVKTFLVSSLPYDDANRLVLIWNRNLEVEQGTEDSLGLSPGAFSDLRESGRSFERIAAFSAEAVNIEEEDGASRAQSLFVAGELFPLLGAKAAIGRTLGPEDEREGGPNVAVISHGYWTRHFGADPRILERKLEFGGRVWSIVGVLPDSFRFTESLVAADSALSKPIDLWTPFRLSDRARGFHYLTTVARLKPGVSLSAAQEEMNTYARGAAELYPDTDKRYGIRVVGLREQIFGHLRPALLTLWAATAFLLCIAGANTATLLIARAQTARRNIAVRLALGSSRQRIVVESLAESVGLFLLGGLLSLGIAAGVTQALIRLHPVSVLQSYPPRIDGLVAAYTLAISVILGLLVGVAPAVWSSRADLSHCLVEGGARLTGGSRRVLSGLVVLQIALATTLLIGMGLSLKSFRGLLKAELGLDTRHVLTFDLVLPRSQYRDEARMAAFFEELLARSRALPGVESVGLNYALPFSGVDPSNALEIEGRTFAEHQEPSANLGFVNTDYFKTLGIPLLQGRSFLPSDTLGAPLVAIVDRRMVDQQFAGQEPLGRRLRIGSTDDVTIVGVVGAVRQDAFESIARPYVYLPYPQRSYMFTSLAIKSRQDQIAGLAPAVRALVRDLDKNVPISKVSSLADAYREAIAPQRFTLTLISVFAALSLLLMLVGTYGSVAYTVGKQSREAGIRMALGAKPSRIFGLVLRRGMALGLFGSALGVAIAFAGREVTASLVYGIRTIDALVFGLVVAAALVAAFVACYLPARRLSRVDPSVTLRLDDC